MKEILDLKNVYEMLSDSESKDIYLNRLNYLITGKYYYFEQIIRKYLPEIPVLESGGITELISKLPQDREIILYGAGSDGEEVLPYFKELKNFSCICDKDVEKQKAGFHGYKVISPKELISNYQNQCVFVSTREYFNEVSEYLIRNGIDQKCIYDIRAYYPFYRKGVYFDEDFITYSDEEIFVDAGCYDLSTTISFMDRCSNVKKVYAFEPDPGNYQKCLKSKEHIKGQSEICIYPCGLWNEKTELKFKAFGGVGSQISDQGNVTVKTCALDDIIEKNDIVTFIKMDIEGAELKALEGAKELIKRHKPKLAVCIYHKPEDMLTIPLYIKSLVPEYKLYIRHYGNTIYETVLYAVL